MNRDQIIFRHERFRRRPRSGASGILIVLGASLWLSAGGCVRDVQAPSRRHPGGDAVRADTAARADSAVIGHLRTRDQFITIHSTPAGPRFSIQTPSGEVVASDLSLQELEAHHPGVHDIYRSAIAGEGHPLDASLWPHASATGDEDPPLGPEAPPRGIGDFRETPAVRLRAADD